MIQPMLALFNLGGGEIILILGILLVMASGFAGAIALVLFIIRSNNARKFCNRCESMVTPPKIPGKQ
jgi:hypothetical protein